MKSRYSVQLNTDQFTFVIRVFNDKKEAVRFAESILEDEDVRYKWEKEYGDIKDIDIYRQYFSASRS